MGHWYNEAGDFVEEIKDLRAARRNGSKFFEGASTITKRMPNFTLDQWKQREAVLATARTPRLDGENDYNWATRVVAAAEEPVKEAADTGLDFHLVAEAVLLNIPWTPIAGLEQSSHELAELLAPYTGRFATEKTVPTFYGFGGRCDMHDADFLGDYKSQNVKGGKPAYYDSYVIQKALYREALRTRYGASWWPTLVTIVVSRNPDSQGAWTYEWTEEEGLLAAYQGLTLVESWLTEKNYRLDKLPRIIARKQELMTQLVAL